MNFKGKAKRLDDIDLPKLGALLGVGEDEIHAFIDAETRGTGFDSEGRPRILFEPHKFFKNLPSKAKRDRAVKAGLAHPKWGAISYGKESAQYDRLERAMKIDETAALKSCSWGLGQVLGDNHAVVGYATVQDFVRAMCEDEENHLKASVDFILANRLDDELREHKWAAFARGYNGPGYRKNEYDIKLAQAYARWSRIRDTPFPEKLEGEPVRVEVPVQKHEKIQLPKEEPVKDIRPARGWVSMAIAIGFLLIVAGFVLVAIFN